MASVITGSCFRLDVNGIVLESLLLMLNFVKFARAVVVIDSFSSLWDSSMKSSNHVPFILLWMGTSLFPVLLTECYRHSLALIWGQPVKAFISVRIVRRLLRSPQGLGLDHTWPVS